jgi:hypothetical protein
LLAQGDKVTHHVPYQMQDLVGRPVKLFATKLWRQTGEAYGVRSSSLLALVLSYI